MSDPPPPRKKKPAFKPKPTARPVARTNEQLGEAQAGPSSNTGDGAHAEIMAKVEAERGYLTGQRVSHRQPKPRVHQPAQPTLTPHNPHISAAKTGGGGGSSGGGGGGKGASSKRNAVAAAARRGTVPGGPPPSAGPGPSRGPLAGPSTSTKLDEEEKKEEERAAAMWPQMLSDLFDLDTPHPFLVPHTNPSLPISNPNDARLKGLANLLGQEEEDGDDAAALKLFDSNDTSGDGRRKWMLIQMPQQVPRKGTPLTTGHVPHASSIDSLPTGKIAKMFVFNNGRVRWQMGDVLMRVDPTPPTSFRQDVVAINIGNPSGASGSKQQQDSSTQGSATWLGQIDVRATISPDMEQLLSDSDIPEWRRGPLPEHYMRRGDAAQHQQGGRSRGGRVPGGDVTVKEEPGPSDMPVDVPARQKRPSRASHAAAAAVKDQEEGRGVGGNDNEQQAAPMDVDVEEVHNDDGAAVEEDEEVVFHDMTFENEEDGGDTDDNDD